jgi:hypothetical protein
MILWKITSTMTFSPMPHFADTVQPGDIEEAAAFPNIERFEGAAFSRLIRKFLAILSRG